ncbi:hypothetical protein NQZ68_040173 [Dissostichus eleginoides]|nr:hypothetical protein NQZ68_040173 [Dissostichus eleginoides]
MAANKKSRQRFLETTKSFLSNAAAIIRKVLGLNNSFQGRASRFEILQSIFRWGRISTPPISPEMIVKYLDDLKDCYPRPFELYCSQLPRRSPFSFLLDMIVFLIGQENEEEIKQQLQEISELHLKKYEPLVSYTTCISQNTEDPNSDRNDKEVKEQARPTSKKFTDDNRDKVKKSVRAELKN